MTYYVFSGTLNPAQSNPTHDVDTNFTIASLLWFNCLPHCPAAPASWLTVSYAAFQSVDGTQPIPGSVHICLSSLPFPVNPPLLSLFPFHPFLSPFTFINPVRESVSAAVSVGYPSGFDLSPAEKSYTDAV